jgi:multidrug resistance efflux pump
MPQRQENSKQAWKQRLSEMIQDHAEEEANALGWWRAREIEELRIKIRKVERLLQRAEEDKEELEYGQRSWQRRRDEAQSGRSAQELKDVHQAMTQLRDALDESEKQARVLEKKEAELHRSVEETSNRLKKLRKAGNWQSSNLRKCG